MEIENYEAVLAVYQYNGWAEAAYQTVQSASNISKRVSKVERELGVPIFHRGRGHGPGVSLTEFGEIILPYIQRIVSSYNHLTACAANAKGDAAAELAVGYMPLMGTVGETDILARFKVDNPAVSLRHVYRYRKDLLPMLRDGKLDCAFVFIVGHDQVGNDVLDVLLSSDMRHIPIMRRKGASVGLSERHPLSGNESVRLSQLYGDTFVFNNSPGHESMDDICMRFFFSQELERNIPVRTVRMDFINRTMVADFVGRNHGVLPTVCIPPQHLPGVRFLPVEDLDISSCAIFIYPSNPSPALKKLIRCVQEYVSERGTEYEPS